MAPTPESIQMLHETRQRAAKLLADLIRQNAELDESPPDIPSADLKEGRQAILNAIAATRKMVQSIDDALRTANNLLNFN